MSASVARARAETPGSGPDAVRDFVARVRAALADLSTEEVEELTGGLEADLADAVQDGADPATRFGDPTAYADELRASAGLPPRSAPTPPGVTGGSRGVRRSFRDAAARLRDEVTEASAPLRRQPWWPAVRDFLVTLRPAWWVLRAWVALALVETVLGARSGGMLPDGPLSWLLLLAFVVGSVELGRRQLHRRPRLRGWVAAGNVLAVLCLPLALEPSQQESSPDVVYTGSVDGTSGEGLWLDGAEVRNVFPFDSQGRPLTDVQLFAGNGRPLTVGPAAREPAEVSGAGRLVNQVPAADAAGRQWWNVYPLRQQDAEGYDPETGDTVPAPTATPYPAPFPAVAPPVLLAPQAGTPASPSPSPSASVTPSASPTPTPTPTPAP